MDGHSAFWSSIAQLIPLIGASTVVAASTAGRLLTERMLRAVWSGTIVGILGAGYVVLEILALLVLAGQAPDTAALRQFELGGTITFLVITVSGPAYFARTIRMSNEAQHIGTRLGRRIRLARLLRARRRRVRR